MFFESLAFLVCVFGFLWGVFVGFVLHGLLRAPRWLVEKLAE